MNNIEIAVTIIDVTKEREEFNYFSISLISILDISYFHSRKEPSNFDNHAAISCNLLRSTEDATFYRDRNIHRFIRRVARSLVASVR